MRYAVGRYRTTDAPGGGRHKAQKNALGEVRSSGATRLLVYCGEYKCAHSVVISADRWHDYVQLSDLEPLFVSQVCRFIGAPTSDLILLGPRVEPLPLGLVSKARRRTAGLNLSDS